MSQLDGAGKISEYVRTAAERGSPAIAFSDHGTMRGYYQQLIECQENKIKPIYGIEFYVSKDMNRRGVTDEEKADLTKGLARNEHKDAIKRYEELEGIRDRWHITVWAKNEEGLKNLYRLSSKAWLEGFYYKPRIDMKTLMEYGNGLMVATGCLSSPINDDIIAGRRKRAFETADMLHERFGEDLWLEVQPHALPDQVLANQFAIELRERYGKHAKLLATQDSHYVCEGDHEHHEVLLCIGTGDSMSNAQRFKFDGDEFWMKTRREMRDTFLANHGYMSKEMIKSSLDNTLLFNELVTTDIQIDRFKALLPAATIPPEYADEWQYIVALCKKGWEWRKISQRAEAHAKRHGMSYETALQAYKERLKMELGAIRKQKFVTYFLIVHGLYDWTRSKGIMGGPGRGSAAGSLVSYLMGITAVDPLEHALLFERFISPTRIDPPDIDMDFEDARRQEILEYLRDKYGADKTCQIATIGKLSGKQCLKDVSRVLDVPLMEVNQVTASIIERSSGDERASQTIEDSFREFKVCQEFNAKYPKVLHHAKKLEGMAKTLGIHAAGVIVAPVPLMDLIPLEVRMDKDKKKVVVSAIDMYGAQAMGLLKMDVLGLRTMTVLRMCLEAIKERHGVSIDLELDVELNEKAILQGFTDHDYVGIFQYDSPGADKICSGVNFESFEDVAAMTALNRPGTARSGLATQYVDRKKNPKLVKKTSFHPRVSEITADTLGIIVYQEHVIRIFQEVAGFNPATADSLRKKIAKKWGDETIGKERENFIKGAMENTPGMDRETAGKIMDAITFFGSYGFNKSHATAYGIIAYWGMWLKRKYPLEFYWALLRNEPERLRIQQFAKDAKKHGIELLPPSVSVSGQHFTIDAGRGAIRGSLVDIKGVGDAASAAIMKAQPFKDFWDFLDRIERRKVHKGVIVALAKSGALDDMIPNIKWFIENIEAFWGKLAKAGARSAELQAMLEDSKGQPDYAPEERMLIASSVSPLAFGKHPVDAYSDFIERHVKVPLVMMSDEDFWKTYGGRTVFVAGVIVEVKYNQIGDFHTGELPPPEERERMGWGKRYANINVEDAGGKQNRIKVDTEIFDDFRDVVDSGVGTPVILLASVNAKYENMRAHFVVDLERYRKKIDNKEALTIWERVLDGCHPATEWEWKTPARAKERMYNKRFHNSKLPIEEQTDLFTGVVTSLKTKLDKRGAEMAFFGLLDAAGRHVEVVCFGSNWPHIKHLVAPGRLMKVALDKGDRGERGGSYILSGRHTEWLKAKKSAAAKAEAKEKTKAA